MMIPDKPWADSDPISKNNADPSTREVTIYNPIMRGAVIDYKATAKSLARTAVEEKIALTEELASVRAMYSDCAYRASRTLQELNTLKQVRDLNRAEVRSHPLSFLLPRHWK